MTRQEMSQALLERIPPTHEKNTPQNLFRLAVNSRLMRGESFDDAVKWSEDAIRLTQPDFVPQFTR